MSAPKIGTSVYEPTVKPGDPEPGPPGVRDLTQDAHVETDLWIENKFGSVPHPPECIQRKLAAADRIYRWVSMPQVKKGPTGMRNYETYSPDAEDRDTIDRGRCEAGIAISTDNRVTWREDSWLASIPRKRYLYRQEETRKRTLQQTQLSKSVGQIAAEAAARSGQVKVQRWVADERVTSDPNPPFMRQ